MKPSHYCHAIQTWKGGSELRVSRQLFLEPVLGKYYFYFVLIPLLGDQFRSLSKKLCTPKSRSLKGSWGIAQQLHMSRPRHANFDPSRKKCVRAFVVITRS